MIGSKVGQSYQEGGAGHQPLTTTRLVVRMNSVDVAQRHEVILGSLRHGGRVGVAEIAELVGCSEMTVRRDLDVLEREGLLRRVRGAAVGMLTGQATPYSARVRQRVEAKRRIGAAVAGMLDEGETAVLDAGTTTLEVARCLVDRRVTVLALSLHAVDLLRGSAEVRLLLPGGEVRAGEQAFTGPLTEHAFRVMRFDTVVLSSCGLSARDGVSAHDLGESAVKLAAVGAAGRVVAAVDSSKFGRTAFGRVCGVEEIDVLVTDVDAPGDEVARIRDAGVEVVLV
ncbi:MULTISPECIES: DeoR/GlpR family DNA-binding transcription regulator [Actinosynnema]|uniref:DeoR/GlpR family DNA-binding transcription regulator n=1 Tax=Actinosynnema TaxID=40566 RepID=UPI0027E30737|nr:DeoR/GlpR family DNA-binding transcription regulator [Actinosynnema pretiosum]MCP2098694.1 transcriptional regulator, DeoR family [Actinosynnema pretiosum]